MPTLITVVRLEDFVIGEIRFNPDGTFEGHFNNDWTYNRILDLFRAGLADGMSISAVPARPTHA